MSNSKIKLGEFTDILMEYLENYKEDIEEEVKETSHTLTQQAKQELKQISPKAKRNVKLKGGNEVLPRKLFEKLVN